MRSDLADITVVVDRSGSMATIVDDVIGGFNTFVADQRRVPGAANLTLVQFDHEYEFVHRAVPIGAVPPLTRETFVPRGATALLDAVGRAVNETGARLEATPESDRPGKVVFVILTDGQENHSREFTRDQVFVMIKRQQEVYQWDFVFLGANQDAIEAGARLGVPAANVLHYAANDDGTKEAFAAISRGVASNRVRSMEGLDTCAYINDKDREEQQRHGAKTS